MTARIRLVRTCCVLVALSARPALANQALIETHAAASYHYVLGKGEAAGRSVLLTRAAAKAKADRPAQGANKLAQCPGCAGESAIAPPRGTH
jgi:hypothetical protein